MWCNTNERMVHVVGSLKQALVRVYIAGGQHARVDFSTCATPILRLTPHPRVPERDALAYLIRLQKSGPWFASSLTTYDNKGQP
jgi:hypothetical protein